MDNFQTKFLECVSSILKMKLVSMKREKFIEYFKSNLQNFHPPSIYGKVMEF